MKLVDKCKIACAIAVLVFSFAPMALYADLRVTARAGFDDYYTPGAWTPVHVIVENFPDAAKGETVVRDFEGRLTVRAGGSVQPRMVFVREVSIPRHSRKHFWLYVKFPRTGQDHKIELSTPREKVVLEQKLELTALKPNMALVVIASAGSGPLYLPTIAEAPYYQTVVVAPGELPDEWYGYDGVGMVVIPRYQTNMFSAEQEKALTSWVETGGEMLVLGGMNSATYRGSFLESVLPVAIRGNRPMEIREGRLRAVETESSAATRILVDDVEVRAGTVVSEAQGMPVAVHSRQGLGRIWYVGLDFQNREMLDVEVANVIWRAICPTKPLNDEGPDAWREFLQQVDFGLGGAARLPNVGVIGFVLIFYILLIGPVNFALLSRKKRLELAWITVPAIAILFAAGIYIAGYLIKGGSLIVREYNVVQTTCNSRYALVDSLVGLFSPRRATYTIQTPEKTQTLLEFVAWDSGVSRRPVSYRRRGLGLIGPETVAPTEVIEKGSRMRLENKQMDQWTLDFFESQHVRDLGGMIEGSLVWSGQSLEGNLVNNTGMNLEDVTLVIEKYGYPLGDFAIGQSQHIAIPDVVAASEGRSGFQRVEVLISEVARKHVELSAPYLKQLPQRIHDAVIRSAVERLLMRGPVAGSFFLQSGRVYLIAFSMDPQAGLKLNSRVNIHSEHTMVVVEIPVVGAESGFTVPFKCAPMKVLAAGDTGRRVSPSSSLDIRNTEHVVSVQLPFAPHSLTLQDVRVQSDFAAGNNQTLVFSAYNVSKSRWDTLPLTRGTPYRLAPAEEYANPITGTLIVQISSQAPSSTGPARTTASKIHKFQVEYAGHAAGKR